MQLKRAGTEKRMNVSGRVIQQANRLRAGGVMSGVHPGTASEMAGAVGAPISKSARWCQTMDRAELEFGAPWAVPGCGVMSAGRGFPLSRFSF